MANSKHSPPKSRRGFAAMSPDLQREIATKGGITVSKNRRHMRLIGQIGGTNSHMAITGKAKLRYVPGQKGRLGKAVIATPSTQ